MTAEELLHHARSRNYRIWLDGERLRCVPPAGDDSLIGDLRASRDSIIAILRDEVITPRGRAAGEGTSEPLPLSFAESRLWFLEQLFPGQPTYNIPAPFRLKGELDTDALDRAVRELVSRHETLRTRYGSRDGTPFRMVDAPESTTTPRLAIESLEVVPAHEREAELARRVHREAQRPCDLVRGPIFRCHLYRLDARDHVLLLMMHHVMSDGWSTQVLLRELAAIYEGRPLPPLRLQYADYAAWQLRTLTDEKLKPRLARWKERFAGVTPLELPTKRRRRPTTARATDPPAETLDFVVPRALLDELHALGRREKVTLFMTAVAAWSVVLGRWASQRGFAIGFPNAGRSRRELEDLLGLFVNTLVLPIELTGAPSCREVLARTRRLTLDAYEDEVPFEKLVDALQVPREQGRSPVFQVMFTLQNLVEGPIALPGIVATSIPVTLETAKFDLALDLAESGSGLLGTLEYRADLFDREMVERLAHHYEQILTGFVRTPDACVFDLPMLTEPERDQLALWGAPLSLPFSRTTIHELFEEQVDRTPDAVALRFGDAALSYRELDGRANQIARRLRARGIAPGKLVALHLGRSIDLVPAILGILKAGAAYLPLDPAYPSDRLATMIADGCPSLVITTRAGVGGLGASVSGDLVFAVDAAAREIEVESTARLGPTSTPRDLAYVIYTSGSTGKPKGVEVEHAALVHFTHALTRSWSVTSADRVLQFTTINWDTSAEELWPCLTNGGVLVVRTDPMLDPVELVASIDREELSVLDLSTAYFPELVRELERRGDRPPSLRLVQFGGDRASLESVVAFRRIAGDGVVLIHGYGVTEGTAMTSTCDLATQSDALADGAIPIGTPLVNMRVYIVDRNLVPVPPGVIGELCIGGVGVARGYLGHPAATSEKFVPDPFTSEPGARMYRTGDLARFRSDGNIELIGRRDHQVKVRGIRVELGEIESTLRQHPKVTEATVVAGEDRGGGKRLIGYATVRGPAEPNELHAFLRERLPEYMVPRTVMILDRLPMLPSGKVDRSALPAPTREERAPRCPPRDATERALSEIWQAVLGVPEIGIHDNFFELGGHSLLAIRLFAAISDRLGLRLPIRALFEAPTIELLGERVKQASGHHGRGAEEVDAIERVPERVKGPLSYHQSNLWHWQRRYPDAPSWNDLHGFRLTGRLDLSALDRAILEAETRHTALRTSFVVEDATVAQVVSAPGAFRLQRVELGTSEDPLGALDAWLSLRWAEPIDLALGPLAQAFLFRLADDDHAFVIHMHRVVMEINLAQQLLVEILRSYDAFASGEPHDRGPESPPRYIDYAVWQRRRLESGLPSQRIVEARRRATFGYVPLPLPYDHPAPARRSPDLLFVPIPIAPAQIDALVAIARAESTSLFTVFSTLFKLFLSRLTGQHDIVIIAPSELARGASPELLHVLGNFVDYLILRSRYPGGASFRDAVQVEASVVREAYANADLPSALILDEPCPWDHSCSRALLNFVEAGSRAAATWPRVTDLEVAEIELPSEGQRRTDVGMGVMSGDGDGGSPRLRLVLFAASDRFERDTVERWGRDVQSLLASVLDS